MNPAEYANLADVEQRHWFYAGKRDLVRHWIRRFHPLEERHLLVDCGAGAGTFAAEMRSCCRVLAVDDHEEALAFARGKLGAERVCRGACDALPLADGSADVLTALDVLEHVREDRNAVEEFARVLKPGGLAVLTVPALMSLWSDWDEALLHFRRYSRRSLLALIPGDRFEILHSNYVNVAALPLVFLVRKCRALKRRLGWKTEARAEDAIPSRPVNALLRRLFVGLACQEWVRFPAGVGLLAVLRRR
jgi:SAM-dependent methyltransferase